MPDKKLTDAEIKKALECCMKLTPDCDDCPYWGVRDFGNCFDFAGQDALDLINCLQAENKRLSTLAELGNTRANDYRVMRDRALKAEAKNERLKNQVMCIGNECDAYKDILETSVTEAKSEAYKEFDELLKEDCLSYPLEKDDTTMLVDVKSYNNLLKELTEKTN